MKKGGIRLNIVMSFASFVLIIVSCMLFYGFFEGCDEQCTSTALVNNASNENQEIVFTDDSGRVLSVANVPPHSSKTISFTLTYEACEPFDGSKVNWKSESVSGDYRQDWANGSITLFCDLTTTIAIPASHAFREY